MTLWERSFGSDRHMRIVFLTLVGMVAALAALPAIAESGGEVSIEWGVMGMHLFGGLALFLFGMEQMSDALKAVAGERMKTILAKLTANRFMGAITGAFVTAVIQSSSVTTVLVVGFITAGLMSMSQSVGIIMGANIGTTITAQIVAFKVTKAALLMIGVGFSMLFLSKQEKIKQYGGMLMGLGMVFFGMSVMSEGMSPLRSYQPFLDLMIKMENPLVGILVAAVFTGLVQSSSATTAIVIVMASQGFITLPAGIALAFGANVGTCVTAMLASIGKPREAVRAAVVHVFFNVAGVLLWVMFIDQLAEVVTWISPSHPELSGTERLGSEAPRQIANAHTIFNIANMLIFIGFTTQIARLVERWIPDGSLEDEGLIVRAKYLDEELLSTPSLALDRVRLEVLHMGECVEQMLERIMPALIAGDREALSAIEDLDDEVDVLYEQIVEYMGKIGKGSLTSGQTGIFLELMEVVGDVENIGDTIETNLVSLGRNRLHAGVVIGAQTGEMLLDLHRLVRQAFLLAVQAVSQNNLEAAQRVVAMTSDISDLTGLAVSRQAKQLASDEPSRVQVYTFEVDIVEQLKHIFYISRRMTKSVMDEEGL